VHLLLAYLELQSNHKANSPRTADQINFEPEDASQPDALINLQKSWFRLLCQIPVVSVLLLAVPGAQTGGLPRAVVVWATPCDRRQPREGTVAMVWRHGGARSPVPVEPICHRAVLDLVAPTTGEVNIGRSTREEARRPPAPLLPSMCLLGW
jgi:hypothetical protein